jgi:hypothetical protein
VALPLEVNPIAQVGVLKRTTPNGAEGDASNDTAVVFTRKEQHRKRLTRFPFSPLRQDRLRD